MSKPKIFISHISEESELAQILKRHLAADFLNLIDVFVSSDDSSIPLGNKWLAEVDDALKAAQIVIVLCSRASVNRSWINFEAGAGWIRDIPVVPVCHSGLKLNDLPIPLKMLQSFEINSAAGLRRLYALLASRLGSSTPTVDFDAIAREVMTFESSHRPSEPGGPREDPRSFDAAAYRRLLKWVRRLVHLHLGDYKDFQTNDWRVVHTVDAAGNGRSLEELTIAPAEKPIYFYLKLYTLAPGVPAQEAIKVSVRSLDNGAPLPVVEMERSDGHVRYVILLDPPSTPERPRRISIETEWAAIWKDLVETGEDEGYFRLSYESNAFDIEFIAPPGRKWRAFLPPPRVGEVYVEPERILWNIKNPHAGRYSYTIFLE